MPESPTMERGESKNLALLNFIAWVEKTEFYGKLTVTFRKGEAIGIIETNETHRLEDFTQKRKYLDVGRAT